MTTRLRVCLTTDVFWLIFGDANMACTWLGYFGQFNIVACAFILIERLEHRPYTNATGKDKRQCRHQISEAYHYNTSLNCTRFLRPLARLGQLYEPSASLVHFLSPFQVRCQFHQHFMSSLSVQKSFEHLFCT